MSNEIRQGDYHIPNLVLPKPRRTENVDEKLKAENQLEWVSKMNNIKNRAEEIILNEVIYQ